MVLDLRATKSNSRLDPEANIRCIAVTSNRISAGLGSGEEEFRLG